MRLRNRLISTVEDLDRRKQVGELSFPREVDFERDLLNHDGCGDLIMERAQATLEAAHEVPESTPITTVASAIAEGIVIGYHLHRAYGESFDREAVGLEP